ncbi:MAG TPA: HAD-IA family hydrolase [Symbiobacteriaceae bacterium]|nr:HAD-IA family hydrolase [Symbiobacteriaceae bacterium]
MRGIFFDLNALVYGPEGADFLSEVLRGEGIQAEPAEVADALSRLPAELQALRRTLRTEEQEDDCNRAMVPALLANLGVPGVTDALLMRLVEAVHQYSGWYSMYPETLPVLEELKNRGYVMAVVANWAPSLGRFLREFELDGYFQAAVASGEVGLSKPDPYIFHQALKQVGLPAEQVFHVGPAIAQDVTGALRAGLTPVWLNRTGIPTGHEVISITDLRGLLLLEPKAGDTPCN